MSQFDDMTMDAIIKSLQSRGLDEDEISKALHTAGLLKVKKEIMVQGKPEFKSYWVNPKEKLIEKRHEKEDAEKKHEEDGVGTAHPRSHPTDGLSTKDYHSENGRYTKERHEFHKQITHSLVHSAGSARAGHKPVAVLMGGGTGTGKTTLRHVVYNKLQEKGVHAAQVDADEMKEKIPEYHHLKEHDKEKAAKLTHDESSDMVNHALHHLIKHKKHFIYDSTMSKPEKHKALVDHLKKHGYEVHSYVTDTDVDTAKKRSDARAERTGRKVPHDVIEKSHKGVSHTVESIKHKVDSYHVYDTTHGSPKLIASKHHIDPGAYKKFLDKGGADYHAHSNS